MTLNNISLSQYIVSKLRKGITDGDLTDFNSVNRTSNYGSFIFPDSPMIAKLMENKNNFPRISVESAPSSSDHRLGQMSDSYLMRETLKVTCFSVRDLICTIKSTTDESNTYDPLVDIYSLDNLPLSDISLVTGTLSGSAHTFVKNTDYIKYDSDNDGFIDSIKWLGVDEPDTGTAFLTSYNRKGTAAEIVRIMAQNINEYFRKNWRLNWTENVAFNYKLIASAPIEFENDSGLYRWEMTIQFNTFNGLEEV